MATKRLVEITLRMAARKKIVEINIDHQKNKPVFRVTVALVKNACISDAEMDKVSPRSVGSAFACVKMKTM